MTPRVGLGERRQLVVVAGFAVAIRVVVALTVFRHQNLGFDARWYHDVGNKLAAGRGYASPFGDEPAVGWPPLFPLTLSAASLLGFTSVLAHRLVGALLGGMTAGATYLLARRLVTPVMGVGVGRRVAVGAGLLAAAYPMLVLLDVSVMSESLYVLVATLMLLALMTLRDEPSVRWAAGAGVAAGAAALTRGDGLFLFPIVVAPVILTLPNVPRQQRLRLMALAGGAAAALVVPWVVRNSLHYDRFPVYSTNLGTTLAGSNCDASWYGRRVGHWSVGCVNAVQPTEPGPLAKTDAMQDEAVEYIRDHVGSLPRVAVIRAVRVWGLYPQPAQADWEADIEGRPPSSQRVAWVTYLAVLPLAAWGWLTLRRRGAALLPVGLIALQVTVIGITAYGNQRFRLAAEPVLLALAATAVASGVVVSRAARSEQAPHAPTHRAPPGRAPTSTSRGE